MRHAVAQLCNEFLRLDIDLPADEDQFVLGFLQAFLIHQEFFLDLFAGTQAGKPDLHIFIGNLAIHADQVFGQRDDPDRLSHVQYENLTAVCNGGCFHHKADRFGNGHKVPDDVRLGHSDRHARLDLLLETRNVLDIGKTEKEDYKAPLVFYGDITFTVDLYKAQVKTDGRDYYVELLQPKYKLRLDEEKSEKLGETKLNHIALDSRIKVYLFKNKRWQIDGDYDTGLDLVLQDRNEAYRELTKLLQSNYDNQDSAREAANSLIQSLIKNLNPEADLQDCNIQIGFV